VDTPGARAKSGPTASATRGVHHAEVVWFELRFVCAAMLESARVPELMHERPSLLNGGPDSALRNPGCEKAWLPDRVRLVELAHRAEAYD
jgi:hypothetical protein